ncbi:N-6-adenine-methyltransferase [Serratia phage vB_SlqS_ZDD2]|nr:N-6-adenine-methyltransferase [Serratia phage vB_SlqS_ZDD2]
MKDDHDAVTLDAFAGELQEARTVASSPLPEAVSTVAAEEEKTPGVGYGSSSNTPNEIKDLWMTPKEVFNYFADLFDIVADVATNGDNSLHPNFITEEEDATANAWRPFLEAKYPDLDLGGKYVWCNPPFSNIKPFVERAIEAMKSDLGTVMLVPADTSTAWFALAGKECDTVRFLSVGRIAFIRADTGKPTNGNNKGTAFFIFKPGEKKRKGTANMMFMHKQDILPDRRFKKKKEGEQ